MEPISDTTMKMSHSGDRQKDAGGSETVTLVSDVNTSSTALFLLVPYWHTSNSKDVLINHLSDLCELRASTVSPKVGHVFCIIKSTASPGRLGANPYGKQRHTGGWGTLSNRSA